MPADVSQLFALAGRLLRGGGLAAVEATQAVAEAGEKVKVQAQSNAPKLTGTLAGSITSAASGLTATVEATAPYAEYVEYGTGHGPPQPYMTPAADAGTEVLGVGLEEAGARALGSI